MPRNETETPFESRDPLSQDLISRSSSEGGSSGGNNKAAIESSPSLIPKMQPTLVEEAPVLTTLEQHPSDLLSAPGTPESSATTEQRRLSSSLPASTAVVEALFGPGLGPCWGDFSCTYNRIRGRLYATSQAVLFYTNLLGFERRICLLLRDISRMELFRTTSLRFSTRDDETYIFKSFNDREQVLHLLNGLKILAFKQQQERGQATAGTPSATRRSSARISSPDQGASGAAFSLSSTFQPISTPHRRRAASDSVLRLPRVDSSGSIGSQNQDSVRAGEDSHSLAFSDTRPGEEVTAEGEDETPDASLASTWAQAKKPKSPPLEEVGVDGIVFPCDMDTFFQTFWADHAGHSFEYYQRDYIKDKDVALTGWDLGSDGYFRRTINFRHPIQNSLGLGPSAADTTRQQKLRTYHGLGIVLENRTLVAGIPAADSFYVQDHWILEALGENQVQLTVRYDTRFTKRSMFKSIITKSIRKETKEWMAGYVDMIQTVLASKSPTPANICAAGAVPLPPPSAELQKLIRESIQLAYRLFAAVSLAFFMLGFVACIHLYRLQQTVAQLHDDLRLLQVCESPSSPP